MKKIVWINLIMIVCFSISIYGYDINNVSDTITTSNKFSNPTTITWSNFTGTLDDNYDSEWEDAQSEKENYEYGDLYYVTKKTTGPKWVKDSSGSIYLILWGGDFVKNTNKTKFYPVIYAKNCTLLVGDSTGNSLIYQFNSSGKAQVDTNATVYNSDGTTKTNENAKNIPVYTNYTGWKQNGNRWYYFVNATTILKDGYAILPTDDTGNNYNLFKFANVNLKNNKYNTGGYCSNVKGQVKTNGSISQIQQSITSSMTKATTILCSFTNSSYNSSANKSGSKSTETVDISKNSSNSFYYILQNTSYSYNEGSSWDTSTKRFYVEDEYYLVNGYAVLSNNSNDTEYELYKISSTGVCTGTGIKGSLDTLENRTDSTQYTLATKKKDANRSSVISNGNTVDNLEFYDNYDGWKKENNKYKYFVDNNLTYLVNGYAILPYSSNGKYAIYKFDSSGYMISGSTTCIADTEEEVRNKANKYTAYNKASEKQLAVSEDDNTTNTAGNLATYTDYNGWTQSGSNWRYYPYEDVYLINGYAIVIYNTSGKYALCSFDSNGYATYPGNIIGNSINSVINSCGSKTYTPATEKDTENSNNSYSTDGDNEESDDNDSFSSDENDIEYFDDGTVMVKGKTYWQNENTGKWYSDEEFQKIIGSIQTYNVVNPR